MNARNSTAVLPRTGGIRVNDLGRPALLVVESARLEQILPLWSEREHGHDMALVVRGHRAPVDQVLFPQRANVLVQAQLVAVVGTVAQVVLEDHAEAADGDEGRALGGAEIKAMRAILHGSSLATRG